MQLTTGELESFRKIWRDLYKEELTLEEAREEAGHLLAFMNSLRDSGRRQSSIADDLPASETHGRINDISPAS